jgi:4-hydroxyphenylacetate 3-monooxygenase
MPSSQPLTGEEFLESIRDGREVWIYGERVRDVTEHPAFATSARQLARLYDALHRPGAPTVPTDTGTDGFTHPFFRAPRTVDDLRDSAAAIAAWSRMTYGWMGRSPDYTASITATFGACPELFEPFQDNALSWYRKTQERVLHVGHCLANPPVDRFLGRTGVEDVHLKVVREVDAGLVVDGAKVVATGAALTNCNYIGTISPIPEDGAQFSATFMVPSDAAGLKVLCRPSYEQPANFGGSPFYYPLSSRFDENDAILVFDNVLVPWENVLSYSPGRTNRIVQESGLVQRGLMHGCIRLAVKFDFLCGLLLKGLKMTGGNEQRGVQTRIGELLGYRNLFWTCVNSMVNKPVTWPDGTLIPNPEACSAYQLMMTELYPRARKIFMQELGSSMTYTGSHAADWHTPEIRPYLDRFLRGSGQVPAEQRVKLMRMIWDAVGSEFAGRHEMYELNYSGNHEVVKLRTLRAAEQSGVAEQCEQLVDQCMADYDTSGWQEPSVEPTTRPYTL